MLNQLFNEDGDLLFQSEEDMLDFVRHEVNTSIRENTDSMRYAIFSMLEQPTLQEELQQLVPLVSALAQCLNKLADEYGYEQTDLSEYITEELDIASINEKCEQLANNFEDSYDSRQQQSE